MCGCSGGGHVLLLQGVCAWFYLGGMRGFIWGVCGFIRGVHGFIRGHAWFYSGGMHDFIQGAGMVLFGGGHAWFFVFSDTMRYGQ